MKDEKEVIDAENSEIKEETALISQDVVKTDQKKEHSKNKKSKKKLILTLIILFALIVLFLFWWFNRKFSITFEYNNGLENYTVKVKYLNKIKDEDVKKDLTMESHTFIGYFETYYLDGKEIEKISKDSSLEKTICKDSFKLNEGKNKCIAINEFDFKKTKIKSNKIIEALWSAITFAINPTEKQIYVGESFDISVTLAGTSDTKVIWSSEDSSIATVNDSGRVVGQKAGKTTIVVESNGIKKYCEVTVLAKEEIKKEEPKKEEPKVETKVEPKTEPKEETKVEPKDEGTISLRANDQCIIGSDTVTITANVSNALDSTVNWSNLKCFNMTKESNNTLKISRIGRGTMCREVEELNPVVTASLNNGSSDSLKFNYEFSLDVTVYDGSSVVQKDGNGLYSVGNPKIVSNMSAEFIYSNTRCIKEKTDNSITLYNSCDGTVTIRTQCGQTKTVELYAIIN